MLNLFRRGSNSAVNNITPGEAKKELDRDKNIVLIDVRNEREYNQKHIPNSTLIPLNTLAEKIETEVPDKNKKIFVYCLSGGRSDSAVRKLVDMGYKNVYNLGGIVSWPYKTE